MRQPPNGRLAVGIAYHAAIEAHELARLIARKTRGRRGRHSGFISSSAMVFRGLEELNKVPVDWDNDNLSIDEARQMVSDSISNWWEGIIPEGSPGAGGTLRERVLEWEPISVEIMWELWLPEQTYLPVVGAADCVYRTPDGLLVVVDHKSATSLSKYKKGGEGLKDQAAMYVLAAAKSPLLPAWGEEDIAFEYHIARTSLGKNKNFQAVRVVNVDVDDVDLHYVKGRIHEAHKQVESGVWPKNPDTWLCSPKWCPFHFEAGGPCVPTDPPEIEIP